MTTETPFLNTFLRNTAIVESIKAASAAYCSARYEFRTSALPRLSIDGMSCHGVFTRSLANYLLDLGRANHVAFYQKMDSDESYIGDLVVFAPFLNQARFDAHLGGISYKLLHMKGRVVDHSLHVAGISKAREEYCRNQSKSVPINRSLLFEEDRRETSEDGKELRIILVTELSRGHFKLWVCLHDGDLDSKDGVIYLSEKFLLIDEPENQVRRRLPVPVQPEVTDKLDEDSGIDFNISSRAS